jgi:hypothetical protein
MEMISSELRGADDEEGLNNLTKGLEGKLSSGLEEPSNTAICQGVVTKGVAKEGKSLCQIDSESEMEEAAIVVVRGNDQEFEVHGGSNDSDKRKDDKRPNAQDKGDSDRCPGSKEQ